MLHWDGKKSRGGEKLTTFLARTHLNWHNGYQNWKTGSQELEQAAQAPWGKAQRYPQASQLWHVNLFVPGALEDLSQALCGPGRQMAAAHLGSASPSFKCQEPSCGQKVLWEESKESSLMGCTTLCSALRFLPGTGGTKHLSCQYKPTENLLQGFHQRCTISRAIPGCPQSWEHSKVLG